MKMIQIAIGPMAPIPNTSQFIPATIYGLTDTGELYAAEVPFGRPIASTDWKEVAPIPASDRHIQKTNPKHWAYLQAERAGELGQ